MVKKLLIIPVIVFAVSYIIPFVYWPEMLNWPFFITNGWLPYRDIAIIHTPFLLGLLVFFYKFFGFTPWTLHLFGSLLLAITTMIVGLISKKISSQIIFGLLVLSLSGNTVWFDILLTPILLLLYWALKNKKFVIAGLLFGLALITKQTTAYLIPVVAFSLFKQKPKKIILFLVAVVGILFLLFFWLLENNLLVDFYKWGVQFVFLKTSTAGGDNSYILWPTLKQFTLTASLFFIPLIFSRNLSFAWMIFSLLFAVPRFDYFHLAPFAAFLAVSVGAKQLKRKYLFLIIYFCLVVFILLTESSLKRDHTFLDRDTLKVAGYVKSNFSGQSLFFLNNYDQVYFLSGKMPVVKPWLPQLPWYLEFYKEKFLQDIKKTKPEIIIATPYLEKSIDGLGAYKPKGVLEYLDKEYMVIYLFPEGTKVYKRL